MATVSGFLLVGDEQINGGPGSGFGATALEADTDGTGRSALMEFSELEPMRILPSDDATGVGTSNAISWWPWFDPDSDYVFQVWATLSSTSNTVTLSTIGAGFLANELAGRHLRLLNTSNIGLAHRATITANTATAGNVTTVTISGTWPVNPVGTQLVVCGRGRWTEYHPAAGYIHPNEVGSVFSYRGGSAESSEVPGVGVGPDAGLWWRLLEQYPTAPRFQGAKFWRSDTVKAGWVSGGAAVTALAAEVALMNTAWAARATGDTLSWDFVVFDPSQASVKDWDANPGNAATYLADIQSAITAIRTAVGNASAKVFLVCHDANMNAVRTPGGTTFANARHRAAAAADANVHVIDLQGIQRGMFESSFYVADANSAIYPRADYWDTYADRAASSIKLANAGSGGGDGGFPVYFLGGDSLAAGFVDPAFATENDSPTLTATPRPGQLIFNGQSDLGEQYHLANNSNTSGTVGATGGPEFSLLVELERLHPEGFLLIKHASVGSSLIADWQTYTSGGQAGGRWSKSVSGEHYEDVLDLIDRAFAWVNTVQDKQADLRGAFFCLGTNDQAVAGGGELFAAALPVFVADFRTDMSTRTSLPNLPIVWLRPQLGNSTVIQDEGVAVRAAIEELAADDARFRAQNTDGLERLTVDNLHFTPDATVLQGQQIDVELATIALGPA